MEDKDAIHQEPYIAFPMSSTVTLRDWFAGQAIAAIYADEVDRGDFSYANVARRAYDCADAMLAARGK
jgi:hypothetical protein